MIPGANLLNKALTVIARQQFSYFQFLSRVNNSIGLDVSVYALPLAVSGSVQAVPHELFERFGLDLTKNYRNFFISRAIMDVQRDTSGDLFVFQGNTYQVLFTTPWSSVDGWDQVTCVQVPSLPLIAAIAGPANGNYDEGGFLDFAVTFNAAVAVTDAPGISLTIGADTRKAAYLSGTGTATLHFRYTVAAEDAGAVSMSSILDLAEGMIIGVNGVPANGGIKALDLSGVTVNA